jgi:outer membrane lipoprotein carrier protein
MKKILFIGVLCFTLLNIVSAQAQTAKSILDNVTAKVKNSSGITANFTYTTTDHNGKKRGTVVGQVFIKGNKYYIKQGTTEIYCDGAKTYNYNAESQEVTVGDANDVDNKSLTPQKLLSNVYDKDFTYTLVSSDGAAYQINMMPVDKRKNFKSVDLYVDKSKTLVTKAKVTDKSDNTIQFSLTNIKTTATIADSKFVFDAKAHPGVDVITQ